MSRPRIPQWETICTECAAGRGQQLLDGFIKSISTDFARTIFLKMSAVLSSTDADFDSVFDWMQRFHVEQGTSLIETASVCCADFGFGVEDRARAERLAGRAYQAELDRLLQLGAGGSA